MSRTYETWDAESLEVGETDDKGFDYQDEPFEGLQELASQIESCGPVEDCNLANGPAFRSVDPDRNYGTGEETYYTFFPRVNEREYSALVHILKAKKCLV